jgi:hypothetical protein
MKKVVIGLATLVAFTGASLAGTEAYSGPGKESKQVITPTCFADQEWQADVFGAYSVGNGPTHAGPIRDHGWGGGIAANYFFARYFGVSAEGSWLAGHENLGSGKSGSTQFQSVGGNAIFRYPIDSLCLAPYAFVGGGATMDGSKWAVGDVGVGVEYRIIPNKLGIFTDGRWNYYGDRYEHDTQNNFLIRAGTRWIF